MAPEVRADKIILAEGMVKVQEADHVDLSMVIMATAQIITLDTVLVLLTLTFSVLLLIFTIKLSAFIPSLRPLMAFWSTESGSTVQIFFQKVAVYNVFMTLLVHVIFHAALATNDTTKSSETDKEQSECVQPLIKGWLVLTIAAITLFLAIIRFFAMVLPHSKVVHGYKVHSPPEYGQPEYNKVAKIFTTVIKPFIMFGFFVLLVIGYIFLSFLPNHPEITSNMEVCASSFPDTQEGKIKMTLLFILLAVLPGLSALAVEHIYYLMVRRRAQDKKHIPGFYLILSSPFVIALYVTTLSGWLMTLTLSLTSMEAHLEIQTTHWEFFAALDSFWMLMLYCACTFKHRIKS